MILPILLNAASSSLAYVVTAIVFLALVPWSALAIPIATKPPRQTDRLGVWLTTVDSQVLYDANEQARALEFLQANGFTRAAVPLYTGGYVTWPLLAVNNGLKIPLDPKLSASLNSKWLLKALGLAGIQRVGWFEFGLMAPASAPWLRGSEHLLLVDRNGSSLWQESPSVNRVWLNPLQPEVQDMITQMVVDACTTLPLDVIQFDDHLGYPTQFGYDSTTLEAWRQTAEGKKQPTPDSLQPEWIAWRSSQVTALLQKIRQSMKQTCPRVTLSVAPNPQTFSYRSYLADWQDWVRRDLVDEVVVQIYRQNLISLGFELSQISLSAVQTYVPVRIGLLAGLRNQPKSIDQLREEIELVQRQGFASVDLFFYESTRDHFRDSSSSSPMPAAITSPLPALTP
jgi:uncharacterized lipoprotein YddW (UPF0748 family)